jgi:hypothetical protein
MARPEKIKRRKGRRNRLKLLKILNFKETINSKNEILKV